MEMGGVDGTDGGNPLVSVPDGWTHELLPLPFCV